MKVRNYENKNTIYLLIILSFIIEIIGVITLLTLKTYSYEKISGIVSNKNTLVLMINKKEKDIIYKNQTAYIDNKKRKYRILENRGKIFSKNKINYYELIINIEFSDNYKPNDLIELSIKNKKYHLIKIFKVIWDGD